MVSRLYTLLCALLFLQMASLSPEQISLAVLISKSQTMGGAESKQIELTSQHLLSEKAGRSMSVCMCINVDCHMRQTFRLYSHKSY